MNRNKAAALHRTTFLTHQSLIVSLAPDDGHSFLAATVWPNLAYQQQVKAEVVYIDAVQGRDGEQEEQEEGWAGTKVCILACCYVQVLAYSKPSSCAASSLGPRAH